MLSGLSVVANGPASVVPPDMVFPMVALDTLVNGRPLDAVVNVVPLDVLVKLKFGGVGSFGAGAEGSARCNAAKTSFK